MLTAITALMTVPCVIHHTVASSRDEYGNETTTETTSDERSRSRLPRRGQGRRRGTGGPEATSSGYYRRHFELNRYRGGWRVRNTDPFAHLVEWGSINNSAYAPIRRAIRTSGLRYVPNPESRGA
jgi:hypothetical protein